MTGRIGRYVIRTYLASFAATLVAGLAIFLVADFVDRSRMYVGPGWVMDTAVLYANKAVVGVRQLGPAAIMLAAGLTVSLLRKRGEVTAMSSLTMGPRFVYLPIAVCALGLGGLLIVLDEYFAVDAVARVEEISRIRFNRWGDWRLYFAPQKWFRRGDRVFYLREGDADRGFADVTVLELDPDFRLKRRLDAKAMTYRGGTEWELRGLVDRTFHGSTSTVATQDAAQLDLGTNDHPFRIRQGRPEQLRWGPLREQIRARRDSGLSVRQYLLALHSRLAYPLAGLPAALLGVGLSLRPKRKGHLTLALVEGVAVASVLWGLMVVLRTLVMAERVSAGVGAWAPALLLGAAASFLWWRREGGARALA